MFPDELYNELKSNYILMGVFKSLPEPLFRTMCNTLITMMLCDSLAGRFNESFYNEFSFLDMSKIEGKELVHVVHNVFERLGAHNNDILFAIKKLDVICKFFRTFKSHKRAAAVLYLEEILLNNIDLNEQRGKLIEHVEAIKAYQDHSHFNLPYFFTSSDSSIQDPSSGETEHVPGAEASTITLSAHDKSLIVMSNVDAMDDGYNSV